MAHNKKTSAGIFSWPALKLTVTCVGIPVESVYQPVATSEFPHVQFRSGPHMLIARTIEGNYPNYSQVIPHEFLADATIPETHRPAVISWLKSLMGKYSRSPTVRLTWETPGQLTLTQWDSGMA